MERNGWIKLHRKFEKWEWYTDVPVRSLFTHLLIKANHQDEKWRGILIKRGQRLTSVSHLSNETGLTQKQVRLSLEKLCKTGELGKQTTSKYSIIDIINYNEYQEEGKQRAGSEAKKGQGRGKVGATNKNDKNEENDKKDKKHIYGEHGKVLLSDEELQKLQVAFPDWEDKIKELDEGIAMKGYKYKSHYLAILKWSKKPKKTMSYFKP